MKAWTASFRYPIFISGFQPTLPVPPLSTIYGILSAAKGELVTPNEARIGYIFKSNGKFVDLESVYELEENKKAKSNVCKREILFEPELYIYVDNLEFKRHFRNPKYQMVIGRSQDIASVVSIKEVELERRSGEGRFGGTIVPFPMENVYGMMQALPTHFTDTIPRQTVGVRPFVLMNEFAKLPLDDFYYDNELETGVYMHE